jgi:hypothetical protein
MSASRDRERKQDGEDMEYDDVYEQLFENFGATRRCLRQIDTATRQCVKLQQKPIKLTKSSGMYFTSYSFSEAGIVPFVLDAFALWVRDAPCLPSA